MKPSTKCKGHTEWEKKTTNHLSDQGLTGTHTTMSKQQTINNGQKPCINIFPQKTCKWTRDIWKGALLVLREMQIRTTTMYQLTPLRIAIIKKRQVLATWWRKNNPCTLLTGMYTAPATTGNNMKFPKKIKNRPTIWSTNPTSGYTAKGNKITISKR